MVINELYNVSFITFENYFRINISGLWKDNFLTNHSTDRVNV